MPIKPITSTQFQESIHPEDREDFIQHKHLLDTGFPSRKITRRDIISTAKHIWWEFRYAQAKNGQDSTRNNVGVNGSA